MIKEDYYTLKKQCLTPYTIDKKTYKVGDMTDTQLYVSKKILNAKKELTPLERRQLEAINYITSYRDRWNSNKMSEEVYKITDDRLKKRAFSFANKFTAAVFQKPYLLTT